MTDEQKALLGDHEAAKRLTEQGVVAFLFDNWDAILEDDKIEPFRWSALCDDHCVMSASSESEYEARLAWNTRAAVEMEGME